MINPIDILIIYLACGAPFGVYYFLKHRAGKRLWFKSFFNFVFWVPYALMLLRRRVNFRKPFFKAVPIALKNFGKENIDALSKRIERALLESKLDISIYEFRETTERYVGLTCAAQDEAAVSLCKKEIFRVAAAANVELGAVCLHRRNRNRLSFHQTEARADFLFLIAQILKTVVDRAALEQSSIELVELLEDFDARQKLEKMFAASQTGERRSVVQLEKDLWKPETHRPPTVRPISHFQPLKATASLRSED